MAFPLNRRQLLAALGLSSSGLFLSNLFPQRARAAGTNAKRRFVFAYFEGGWDILLGLDPRDPALVNPAQNQIDPGYGLLGYNYQSRGVQSAGGLSFGPAVPPQMLAHADKVSIINGVTMDTASHDTARRYFITGQFPIGITAVGASAPAQIVSQLGNQTPIPYLAAGVEAYAPNLPSFAQPLNVNSVADLVVALEPIATFDPDVKAAAEAYQDQGPGCAGQAMDRNGIVSMLVQSVATSRAYLKAQLGQVFDTTRTDAAMTALKTLYGVTPASDPSSPQVMALVAGQAVKAGVSQCVSVTIARTLDTHSNWANDQAPRQEQGWMALAALISDLAATPSTDVPGATMLDQTTILAFSEFGRQPLFNTIRGRDHFLGNSCLVAGAGIRPGLTIGGSASVGMMPVGTDMTTGLAVQQPTQTQLDSGQVQTLTPKHVLATMLASVGLDPSYLRADPIKPLLA